MIVFKGERIPDFVKVNSIEFSVLPPITNNLLKVRGKHGAYHFSQDIDVRTITVNITIIAEEINKVMSASRTLAEWLYSKEPAKLVLDDEPDKYYLAVFDGESNITEIVNIGQGSLTFICVEPFAFGKTVESELSFNENIESAEITVDGTYDTYPILDFKVKEPLTSLTVATSEDALIIGEPAQAEQSPKNPKPIILLDDLTNETLPTWVKGEQVVDGGDITGDFVANSVYFKVDDYGTGSRWHGASRKKMLDKAIHDFEIQFGFEMSSSNKKQTGRIELYLLDEKGVQFGKIALVDRYNTIEKQVLEARAGAWGTGTYFASGYGDPEWLDFYGRIILKRTGRQWEVSIAPQIDGKLSVIYTQSWFDSSGMWDDYKLGGVQIHIGKYGNTDPIKTMTVNYLRIHECIELEDNEAPIIAIAGDEITIDNEKMIVYLNGIPRFDLINPVSTFIKFKKGQNIISVTPSNVDMVVSYKERWL
jgi:predicted phage tail component-like protein